jgi:HlyD family secretion protein
MTKRLLPASVYLLAAAMLVLGTDHAAHSQSATAMSIRGRVEGGDLISLGASTTGTISQLLVKPGDHVDAGQPLLRVDCRDLESEIAARKADLAVSEAILARVTHGSRPEEIAIGEANVNLAAARLHEAQKEFDRAQSLHEGVTVTRVQIDQAERDARMASAMLEEVRAKLVLLKVGSREEDIAEARARRDAAKARVDAATARLNYCTVTAPISGVILSTRVSPGQLISLMAPATLITMVDDSKRRARAFVPERDAFHMCAGEQARISADGNSGEPSEGRIEKLAPELAESPDAPGSPHFRAIELSLADNEKRFLIGQSVTVKLLGCGS